MIRRTENVPDTVEDTQQIDPTITKPWPIEIKFPFDQLMELDLVCAVHLVLANFLVMLINTLSSEKPCTKRDGDKVEGDPGNEDTHILADFVLGVEDDLRGWQESACWRHDVAKAVKRGQDLQFEQYGYSCRRAWRHRIGRSKAATLGAS